MSIWAEYCNHFQSHGSGRQSGFVGGFCGRVMAIISAHATVIPYGKMAPLEIPRGGRMPCLLRHAKQLRTRLAQPSRGHYRQKSRGPLSEQAADLPISGILCAARFSTYNQGCDRFFWSSPLNLNGFGSLRAGCSISNGGAAKTEAPVRMGGMPIVRTAGCP